MSCGCKGAPCKCGGASAPSHVVAPAPSRYALAVRRVSAPRHPNCALACHWPDSPEIEVVAKWWDKLTDAQRAFATAHELAHKEPGPANVHLGAGASERSADERAGAIMFAWGYTLPVTVAAARAVVSNRPAWYEAQRGWEAMRKSRRG